MATLAAAAARRAATLSRVSSPKAATNFIQRRGLAGAAGKSDFQCFSFIYFLLDLANWKSESESFCSLYIAFYLVPKKFEEKRTKFATFFPFYINLI